MIFTVAILLAVLCYFRYRRRQADINVLKWPPRLNSYRFRDAVRQYIISKGWKVTSPDTPVDLFAVKNGGKIMIRCCATAMPIYINSAKDLAVLYGNNRTGRTPIVVSADFVELETVLDALESGVYILHYSLLNQLANLDIVNRESVKQIVADSLEVMSL